MKEVFSHVNSKGVTYYLNTKDVTLKNGRSQRIYYFSRDSRETGCAMPAGYMVTESSRTSMPILQKVK